MIRRTLLLSATILAITFLFFSLQSFPSGQAQFAYLPRQRSRYQWNTTDDMLLFQPPLRTAGRHIIDANGERVKLASINWYGASVIFFVPGGLDFRHRDEIAATIRQMGFNSVRFPYSDQMVIENPIVPPEVISANLDLLDNYDLGHNESLSESDEPQGPRALDVYFACVKAMTDIGLAVIPNDHITNAHWCDGMNLCDSSWKNDHLGPFCKIKQTTDSWIDNWKIIMRPLADNPLVIGADLRNEPRGFWGTMTWNMWATAAEKASEALLSIQPNWLMFVEGISSANDCGGARSRPIKLSVADRVVYSSHVYSWSGWSTLVPYGKRPYPSFPTDMDKNWAFLIRGNIAPVWVGESGAPHHAGDQDRNYWDHLMKFLDEIDADYGYWALNPRKPGGYDNETYGLLRDDWETPVDDYRLADLQKLMKPRKERTVKFNVQQ
ncbi:Endoglucanase E1 [Fulvia fulva]|uniref:Endoglucanase E1 n=1 Tax=Passalora fulva TaxID=5499 RepID=A0A9Q8P4Y4_PASFU|nr:Endoglucanase E1 [Fulvia fulva]KAK4631879.1 Endoglucanase E1 [Fulvia fulva]KAK4633478.1 Endoglucanase E1 [Fulvia fulva]UJO13321.1 Endoglucanase E1 [Fulvia fulva]WPV11229.1 Endoglucanase E1 [Fulvia fulva]WPV25541.1 Endoglucanase E1 [Fulvia fulva]